MTLEQIIASIKGGTFSCSNVLDILMDQPTNTQAGRVESHAHMHVKEGFKIGLSGFGGDDFSLSRKKLHWENPTHLYAVGDDYGRMLVDSGTDARTMQIYAEHYGGVFQDRGRLPPDNRYANRSGQEELKKTKYTIYKYEKENAPPCKVTVTQDEIKNIEENLPELIGREKGKYAPKSTKCPTKLRFDEKTEIIVSDKNASPAHSMFPDSESLVMHLTAALMSPAGIMVLNKLMEYGPGAKETVGIFSKSARLAVEKQLNCSGVAMLNRTLEVDTSKPRDDTTGLYPTTGRIIETPHNIDHIVAVLGYRQSGELNVITCFPSAKNTEDSIKTATDDNQDIAELKFGEHTKVDIDKDIKLFW